MPDSCGTPTRRIMARNIETGEEVEVIIVVGDERAEFNGVYSFDLAQLRRVIGATEAPPRTPLFHPTTGEESIPSSPWDDHIEPEDREEGDPHD